MVRPATTVEEAIAIIEGYQGRAEDFELAIADSLLDSTGIHMAMIGEHLIGKGFCPEQRDGYRVYRYSEFE